MLNKLPAMQIQNHTRTAFSIPTYRPLVKLALLDSCDVKYGLVAAVRLPDNLRLHYAIFSPAHRRYL